MVAKRVITKDGDYSEDQRKHELNNAAKELSECRSFIVITTKGTGGSAISALEAKDLMEMSISCLKMAFELKEALGKIGELINEEENR